jgi:hypothetical protein
VSGVRQEWIACTDPECDSTCGEPREVDSTESLALGDRREAPP